MLRTLSRVRGAAHDAIIGEWIRCWIELNPEDHLAFNPAPASKTHVADIMFLEAIIYEEVEGKREPTVWAPSGVAEVENSRKKWLEKLESLKEYAEAYPLKFVLLCVRTYLNSKIDMESFEQLKEKIRVSSQDMLNVNWILYRLIENSYNEDTRPVVFSLDPEAEVIFYRFISSGEMIIFRKGEVKQRFEAFTDGVFS